MLSNELKKQIKKKQQEYLFLKAAIMAMEEIDTESKQRVLKKYKFIDDEGKRITDPKQDWRMKDDLFRAYLKVVMRENIDAGLKIDSYEMVIAWRQKEELKKVEDELLELQLQTIPTNLIESIKKAQKHWKYKDEALDLILRLEV